MNIIQRKTYLLLQQMLIIISFILQIFKWKYCLNKRFLLFSVNQYKIYYFIYDIFSNCVFVKINV